MDVGDVPKIIAEVDRQTHRKVRPFSITLMLKYLGETKRVVTVFRAKWATDATEAFNTVEEVLKKYQKTVARREQSTARRARPAPRWIAQAGGVKR